jgi:hypothetical protein
MKLANGKSKFAIFGLLGFFIAVEIALAGWRDNAPVSHAPVFKIPFLEPKPSASDDFQRAITAYKADRGSKKKIDPTNSVSLTAFYFEWDRISVGPLMTINGHSPEECNVAAGYKLISRNENRIEKVDGCDPLNFDVTQFVDPAGNDVYVYKTAWLQGVGSRALRAGENRIDRIKNSFTRGQGAARVLECGVTGAQDESQAWEIFHREILAGLVWDFNP